jgi:hypothetical protein
LLRPEVVEEVAMLVEFLLDLMTHPEKLSDLKENRDAILGRVGFSDIERKAIDKGDIHKLRVLLREEVSRS